MLPKRRDFPIEVIVNSSRVVGQSYFKHSHRDNFTVTVTSTVASCVELSTVFTYVVLLVLSRPFQKSSSQKSVVVITITIVTTVKTLVILNDAMLLLLLLLLLFPVSKGEKIKILEVSQSLTGLQQENLMMPKKNKESKRK